MRTKQKLQKKAATDALTGLLNRASVLDEISSRLEAGAPKMQALLFIDIDGFKQVNDCRGHLFGDEVLRRTANELRRLFGAEAVVGRVGGDEFLVFLPDLLSRECAARQAGGVVQALSRCENSEDDGLCVTCSVGIALHEGGLIALEQLYERADSAMYSAKRRGRNRFAFYEA